MAKVSKNNEIIKDKRLKNLEKGTWKKGQSGNPSGHPLGQKNYATLYKEALIKLGQLNNKTPDELELELISSGFTNARKGDYRFYKDVLDRIHGSAIQNIGLKLEPDELVRSKSKDLIKDYLDGGDIK